jgi:hypothetical protein
LFDRFHRANLPPPLVWNSGETAPENVCRLPLKPNALHIGKDCLGDLSLASDFIVGSGDITEQERA